MSIIGAGKVGTTIAFLSAVNSLDDIVLLNRHSRKAIGQALDISNAIPKDATISIKGTEDYSMIKNSKVVVITASSGTYFSSRTQMLSKQIDMIRKIGKEIKTHAPDAIIIMITNPVDELTYILQKEFGFQPNKVIGLGSNLDSSRFRYFLAKELEVNQSEITDAMVLGEHGDSMIPIFSQARMKNTPILEILDTNQVSKITKNVKDYWKTLRNLKGRSYFGIAKNTVDTIQAIINNAEITTQASILVNNKYKLSDICLGVPVRINSNGAVFEEIKLSKLEMDLLHKSALVVNQYIEEYE